MDNERIWKVYIHEFPNGKVYIGITSKSVYKRWGLHGSGYNAQEKTGISHKRINHCCGGFSKSCNGFNWEWYENYERMISQ